MTDLRSLARALDGEVSAGQVLAPAPGHSRRDRSMSVRIDPRAPGGLLVHLFSGGDPINAKNHVLDVLGWPRQHGRTMLRRHEYRAVPVTVRSSSVDDAAAADRTARALGIWQEARSARGTPVEAYFVLRGLQLPPEASGRAIRYHPSCPFARGHRTPAMVCLVRDIHTNEPRAIHRTALDLGGRKVEVAGNDRLSLGPVSGGAIKITPDTEVGACLGVGEGIESALSLRMLPEFGSGPIWSLISANGVERLPVLAGVESLWIAVDHDAAGVRASEACAERWRGEGAETFLVKPRGERSDLNDLFKVRADG